MEHYSLDEVNRFILAKQHLAAESRSDDVVGVVRDIAGLHGTYGLTPYLSLLARRGRFEPHELDTELYEKRTLGRIRCVRNTIYVLPKDFIPVAYAATVTIVGKGAERYLAFRGVSPEQFHSMSAAILGLVEGREMTASEIKKELRAESDVSAIITVLCDRGLLIRGKSRGGWKDKHQVYALFREYLPDVEMGAMGEDRAVTLLVRRYLEAFGPSTENDVVWWTGLGKTKVRAALQDLQDQLTRVGISGLEGDFVVLRSDAARIEDAAPAGEPVVNLLPPLDSYVMGYKDRRRYIEPEDYDRTFDRSGNATSTVLVSGRVVGVWDFEAGEEPSIKLLLFRSVDGPARDAIHAGARRLGRFMAGEEVRVRECRTMTPLPARTAGGFMSPLKGCQGG